jgi:putative membrane protein
MSNFSQITKVAAALAALARACGGGATYAATPTDPQIAHVAYTAGQIDIAAARTLTASME